jgi:hypothetical protein
VITFHQGQTDSRNTKDVFVSYSETKVKYCVVVLLYIEGIPQEILNQANPVILGRVDYVGVSVTTDTAQTAASAVNMKESNACIDVPYQ